MLHNFELIFGCTSVKDLLSIILKLTIPTCFEALITNMMMKIPDKIDFQGQKKKMFLTSFLILCR